MKGSNGLNSQCYQTVRDWKKEEEKEGWERREMQEETPDCTLKPRPHRREGKENRERNKTRVWKGRAAAFLI